MQSFRNLPFAALRGIAFALFLTLAGCAGGGTDGAGEPPETATSIRSAPASLSDQDAVTSAQQALSFELISGMNRSAATISADLRLPPSGSNATHISWASNDTTLIDSQGRVSRPPYEAGDHSLVLTATVSRGKASASRQFVLTVLAQPFGDSEAVSSDAAALDFGTIGALNSSPTQISLNLNLPVSGSNGSAIQWQSSHPGIVSAAGVVRRPASGQPDAAVTLTATLNLGDASAQKIFSLVVSALAGNDFDAISADHDWLGFEVIRGGNSAPTAIVTDLLLPAAGPNASIISWRSDAAALSDSGRVNRPEGAGSAVNLTATLELGVETLQRSFELVVLGPADPVDYRLPPSGIGVFHLESPDTEDGDAAASFTLDLGEDPKDVYLIVTNPSQSDARDFPVLGPSPLALPAEETLAQARSEARSTDSWARQQGEGVDCPQDVALFNSDPWRYGDIETSAQSEFEKVSAPAPPPVADMEGDSRVLFDADDERLDATCRKVVSNGTRTLSIWVADDAWSGAGCSRVNCTDQSQVDQLAAQFLRPGPDNDIYDWVSGIFGSEWGAHDDPGLIAPDGNISIFLFDINDDNSTNGGVLGYFHSRNNFRAQVFPSSNERLMFALDSVLFATSEGGSWELYDRWPQRLVSTLAHEFQHMVHFYQKQVLARGSSETWLNEMSSMVTQDLVESRLHIDGPRGVPWFEGSAGSTGNTQGRLGRFIKYDYLPLAHWFRGGSDRDGDDNVLNSYAINYAFGAYLARNFGGASFFRALVQNPHGGARAIDAALLSEGYPDESFETVLQKWGAATLLSDHTAAQVPPRYRYNNGSYLDASIDAMPFQLGSINLYNYNYDNQSGPKIFTSMPRSGLAGRYKSSNYLYRLGTGLSGVLNQEVTLAQGTRLSVVIK